VLQPVSDRIVDCYWVHHQGDSTRSNSLDQSRVQFQAITDIQEACPDGVRPAAEPELEEDPGREVAVRQRAHGWPLGTYSSSAATFDNAIDFIRRSYGFSREQFLRRFRGSHTVFNKAKYEVEERDQLRAQ